MLGGAKAVNDTAVETGIVEQVHGCHRRCVRGPRGRLRIATSGRSAPGCLPGVSVRGVELLACLRAGE